jgi:protein involved in polysaccharide export with SLBB domain
MNNHLGNLTGAALLLALCLVAFSPTQGARAAEMEIPVYTLGAGDRVKVTVFGENDLSGEFEISGDGGIAFPLVGKVRATGLSLRQLEQEIARMLMDGYLKKPRVNAEVVNYRPFYILGEVKRPGSYSYVSGMTVINAVALGGGFTYRAQKGRMTITRGSDKNEQGRPVKPEDVVLPGDIIRVPERFF